MSDYITTYTGKHFEPMNPDSELVCIEDIAHALPMICRGNGHVTTFWSVGEHCICCAKEALARGLSKRLVLACLLHDASECYMSDVPRPFKKMLPAYTKHEEQLLSLIYEKFLGQPLSPEGQAAVKAIDDDLLYYDLKTLLGETPEGPVPELKAPLSYEVLPFEQVEREYLELFERWTSRAEPS